MRDNLGFALEGAWQVLAAGLLLGAGLPAVFALGIRSLAWGTGGAAEVAADARPHPAGRALAGLCFLVVVVGIGAGLYVILAAGGIA
ncbi:hypothetical protein [Nocardioides flavescens]|uniref:Uncharacterized protein n=1 Tax=Nocardioides flavescens TaxID=2691959 RepID=A0A6L7F3V6_9ACTN|nr:hypothetical protein [Nocardioides flavescens]MXG91884.1 hypothetical protein [Nocardioides flavescens]